MSDVPQYRYADGPSIEVTRVIHAAPEALWALITDINLSARFSSEFQGAEWLDGATAATLGARFQGSNNHPAVGTWSVTCTITDFEPTRVVGWTVDSGAGPDLPAAHWSFTLEPVDGGTLVTQRCQLGPGPSGLSPAIERMPDREHDILSRRFSEHRANMEANLAGLATLTEPTG
jgi:uncharacterized protein YndB with AHSA1/START domain